MNNQMELSLKKQNRRRYDFDWLRLIIIINLIPFHVAWLMVFVNGFSEISKDTIYVKFLFLYFVQIAPIHMPLLFLISGYATAVSLKSRSINGYIQARTTRLLIPLVSYIILLRPIQNY